MRRAGWRNGYELPLTFTVNNSWRCGTVALASEKAMHTLLLSCTKTDGNWFKLFSIYAIYDSKVIGGLYAQWIVCKCISQPQAQAHLRLTDIKEANKVPALKHHGSVCMFTKRFITIVLRYLARTKIKRKLFLTSFLFLNLRISQFPVSGSFIGFCILSSMLSYIFCHNLCFILLWLETVECLRLIFWPWNQRRSQYHTAKPIRNNRSGPLVRTFAIFHNLSRQTSDRTLNWCTTAFLHILLQLIFHLSPYRPTLCSTTTNNKWHIHLKLFYWNIILWRSLTFPCIIIQ